MYFLTQTFRRLKCKQAYLNIRSNFIQMRKMLNKWLQKGIEVYMTLKRMPSVILWLRNFLK